MSPDQPLASHEEHGSWVDMESSPRREHFHLFRAYDRPQWGLCADVDVTLLHSLCESGALDSFFLASLYLSIQAANQVEEMKHRLRGDRVWRHETIHAGSTVLRDDETFAFAYFPFDDDFGHFQERGRSVIDRIRNVDLPLEPHAGRDDLVYFSVLPWVNFRSFYHARNDDPDDAIPRIVLGKHHERERSRLMPVSIDVHHALVDGLHIGRFLAAFQAKLDAAESLLTGTSPLAPSPEV